MGQYRETYMKRHIKSKHSNEKALEATYEEGFGFECDTCGSEFDRNINFQNHMKRHSSENANDNLHCGNCLLYLASKDSLKRHIKLKYSNENISA